MGGFRFRLAELSGHRSWWPLPERLAIGGTLHGRSCPASERKKMLSFPKELGYQQGLWTTEDIAGAIRCKASDVVRIGLESSC